MLFLEQPIGVGFSHAGTQKLPVRELEVGAILYRALQNFYHK